MEKCKPTIHDFHNETTPFAEGMIYVRVLTKLDVIEAIGLLGKKGQW